MEKFITFFNREMASLTALEREVVQLKNIHKRECADFRKETFPTDSNACGKQLKASGKLLSTE